MQMLKSCLNPKVVVGLIAAGVAIYLVAPGFALAALPLLVLAVCPLSMFLMMRLMRSDASGHGGHAVTQSGATPGGEAHAGGCCQPAQATEQAAARLPQ